MQRGTTSIKPGRRPPSAGCAGLAMARHEPLRMVSDSEDAGGELGVTILQPLQAVNDSDSDGSGDPPLVLAEWGLNCADDDDEQCEVAATTRIAQPLLQSRDSSDDYDYDEGGDEGPVTLAMAGDHAGQLRKLATASDGEGPLTLATAIDNVQPCMLATASDDERCLGVGDEAASSGPSCTKRARCSMPSLPAAVSQADVQSLFFWPRVALQTVLDILGLASLLESCLFEHPGARMSTHFSGLGSAEMAWRMVCSWARMIVRRDVALADGWACEKSRSLQQLLRDSHGSTCVFTDILDRLPDLDDELRNSSTIEFQTAKETVMRSRVVCHANCATHGCQCPVSRTEVDVSGSSCRPWSRARLVEAGGQRRNHKDILLLLAWCRILREDKPGIVIHENVRGFDGKILEELLGDMYDITAVDVLPEHLGFSFVARPRVYSILTLRGRILRTTDVQRLYRAVAATAARTTGPLPSVLLAELPEVLAAENLVRAQGGMSEVVQPSSSWRYLLTDRQATCLSSHEEHWRGATLMEHYVDLSQSLRFARPRTVIPTMRRSASRIWSWKCERWLLPSEHAAAMGYPIHPWCAQASGVPVDTTVLSASKAIGNAMHVANVGSIMVCALAACRRVAGHG